MKTIAKYEHAVWHNTDSFMVSFSHSKQPEELLGVWFNTENVKFNYLLESGQHVTYDCKLEEFLEWYKTVLDGCE